MKEKKLTVRVTQQEYNQILKQADATNLSINRYLVQCAVRPNHGNEKQLSELMKQLCILQNHLQTANTNQELLKAVRNWRLETLRLMGV